MMDATPWTSSPEVLEVLLAQLWAIQRTGGSILSSSVDFEADRANLRLHVEDISASALSGHLNVVPRRPDDEEVVKSYEETKPLYVPLLMEYANNKGDDLVALRASLGHSHFEGIV